MQQEPFAKTPTTVSPKQLAVTFVVLLLGAMATVSLYNAIQHDWTDRWLLGLGYVTGLALTVAVYTAALKDYLYRTEKQRSYDNDYGTTLNDLGLCLRDILQEAHPAVLLVTLLVISALMLWAGAYFTLPLSAGFAFSFAAPVYYTLWFLGFFVSMNWAD